MSGGSRYRGRGSGVAARNRTCRPRGIQTDAHRAEPTPPPLAGRDDSHAHGCGPRIPRCLRSGFTLTPIAAPPVASPATPRPAGRRAAARHHRGSRADASWPTASDARACRAEARRAKAGQNETAPKAARSAAPGPHMLAGAIGVSLQSERTTGAVSSVSSPEAKRRRRGCRGRVWTDDGPRTTDHRVCW